MAKYSKSERAESLERLRELCPPGTTIYTTVRSVSRSGMSRQISLFVMRDGELIPISLDAARCLDWPINDGRAHWAIKVSGCGMDMCFHTVHSLSYALHGTKGAGEGLKTHPRKVDKDNYRAGYSLTARDI